jgi:hypothetical protein
VLVQGMENFGLVDTTEFRYAFKVRNDKFPTRERCSKYSKPFASGLQTAERSSFSVGRQSIPLSILL